MVDFLLITTVNRVRNKHKKLQVDKNADALIYCLHQSYSITIGLDFKTRTWRWVGHFLTSRDGYHFIDTLVFVILTGSVLYQVSYQSLFITK